MVMVHLLYKQREKGPGRTREQCAGRAARVGSSSAAAGPLRTCAYYYLRFRERLGVALREGLRGAVAEALLEGLRREAVVDALLNAVANTALLDALADALPLGLLLSGSV